MSWSNAAEASPTRDRDALLALRLFDLYFALKRGLLFTDDLLFLKFGDAHGLFALRFTNADFLELDVAGDLHVLIAVGLGDADFAFFQFIGDIAARALDGFGGGLLADGFNVSGVVGDVGDIDVDQDHADLAQFGLEIGLDVVKEGIAVAVDVLDAH